MNQLISSYSARPGTRRMSLGTLIVLIGAVSMLGLFACAVFSGCSNAKPAQRAELAKIGKVAVTVESPTTVRIETQIAVSEYLQRAVKPAQRVSDAKLFSFVADTIHSFDGATVPTAAEVEARVQSLHGTITDPDFPLIVGVGLDAWTVARQLIPAGATPDTVKAYLDAASAGTVAGAASYLAPTGEAP